MNPNIFKSYDIRGKYPQEINEKIVSEIILKLSNKFSQKSKIVIGYDARLSSLSLYRAAINSVKRRHQVSRLLKLKWRQRQCFTFSKLFQRRYGNNNYRFS